MRILVVNWQDRENPHAGGAELHLHEVFGRIVTQGHEVDLLCSGFEGGAVRATIDGIAVHRVGRRFSFPLHARRYFDKRLRSRAHDVLVEDLNKVPLFTTRWGTRRVVGLVHHLFGESVFREAPPPVAAAVWLLERPLGRAYGGIPFQAVSKSSADDLVRRGIPQERIRVIYNGVDIVRLTPDPGARTPHPSFAYLGRLRRYKNVGTLIRALKLVPRADVTLDIAGTGPDRERLERLVQSLDLASRVKFLGFVSEPDKLSLLRRSWATLLASPKEGWGISNLESAACGTPVIAADAPGVRESVRDGETGILVKPNGPAAFAAAIERLCADPGLVVAMGAAARNFAGYFTWDRAARDTLEDLHDIINGER
ncbi:MAG TPA: glycosyltransferase family 4 protein [Gemmatimonadaceae bacterium]|nr:glycosyltransferase family 4 protein [Gemmatimonadaceae bacterium]